MIRWIWFFLLPVAVVGFEEQPWFGDVYEFNWLSKYTYAHYGSVNGAVPSLDKSSDNHFLYLDLEFPFSPDWDAELDLHFADTAQESFNYTSTGFQVRHLFWDDIIGDPITFVAGLSFRYVPHWSVTDIATPYYGAANFEGQCSFGKEFDHFEFWRFRLWGFAALGVANIGSPWMRAKLAFEGNVEDRHKWAIQVEGAHSFGRKVLLSPDFNGYARVRSKNIDITGSYGYTFGPWGTIRLYYTRRLLAKRFPDRVNAYSVSYLLPFSF